MRTTIAAAAIAASLLMPGIEAQAQIFNRNKPASGPIDPNTNQASAVGMIPAPNQIPAGVLPYNTEIPPPDMDDVKPTIPLPTGPIEPYLLTREHGPFMVLAYSFRGPDAPRQALALVLELRSQYKLPAYILLPKKFPGRSIIRGVPPQTPPFVQKDDVGLPELLRTLDEAAVMVGNEKTTKDSIDLMNKIKAHPQRQRVEPGAGDHQPVRPRRRPLRQAAGRDADQHERRPAQHQELPGTLHAPGRQLHRPVDLRPQERPAVQGLDGQQEPARHRRR
jgi:hypothetical protein